MASVVGSLSSRFIQKDVEFVSNNDGLSVAFYTENFRIESVKPDHCENCIELLEDEECFGRQLWNPPLSKEGLREDFGVWIELWSKRIPYSLLVVLKKGAGDFMGQVIFWKEVPSGVTLSYDFKKKGDRTRGLGSDANEIYSSGY